MVWLEHLTFNGEVNTRSGKSICSNCWGVEKRKTRGSSLVVVMVINIFTFLLKSLVGDQGN